MNSESDLKFVLDVECLVAKVKEENLSDVEDYLVDPECLEASENNSFVEFSTGVKEQITEGKDLTTGTEINFFKSEVKDYINCSYEISEEDTENEFKCHACQFTCQDHTDIKLHLKNSHDGEKVLYSCIKCTRKNQYQSYDYRLFVRHINNNHKSKYFDCEHCDLKFRTSPSLKSHIAKVHPSCRKKLQCDRCDYRSAHLYNLKIHIRKVHDLDYTLNCDLCDFKTCENFRLKIHVDSVHLKKKRFECQFCDFRTYQGNNLRAHVKIVHLKEKLFKCDVCGKTFGRNWDLRRHVEFMHAKNEERVVEKLSENDSLKCTECEFVFKHKYHLKIHAETVHSGKVVNIQCELCDFSTKYKNSIKLHMNRVHLKKVDYKCEKCRYTTRSEARYKSHMEIIHQKEGKSKSRKRVNKSEMNIAEVKCGLCSFECAKSENLEEHLLQVHKTITDEVQQSDGLEENGSLQIKEEQEEELLY